MNIIVIYLFGDNSTLDFYKKVRSMIDFWEEDELDSSQKKLIQNCKYYNTRPILGKILVLPEMCVKNFQYPTPWAAISIIESTRFNKNDLVKISDINRVNILNLGFDDIPRPIPNLKHFNHIQAQEIWSFVKGLWSDIDLLMIHCYAGLSRSTAVAKAISSFYQNEYAEIFTKIYSPNPLVFRTMVENYCAIL